MADISAKSEDTVSIVHAVLTLLNPQGTEAEKAFALHGLQKMAESNDDGARLPTALLLYFQKDPRAYQALLRVEILGPFWPVRTLLHEYFLLRCRAVGLGTRAGAPLGVLICQTRLNSFPLAHPYAVPSAKPAGAARHKE